jgi:ribosomal protein S18 acetylase RimI-like enzyme
LQAAPEAFSSSHDEEAARPLEWFTTVAGGTGSNATFGAFHADSLVGMAGFVVSEKAKEHHKGTLVGLYVQPSSRRRGIARLLVKQVIDHASGRVLLLNVTVTATLARGTSIGRPAS